MPDTETAFNMLTIVLEVVLFTSLVAVALAVRSKRQGLRAGGEAIARQPVLASADFTGEASDMELLRRRRFFLALAIVVSGMVVASLMAWVAIAWGRVT
ncbi:MAG: hypothetical protein KIT79_10455 [Deltaproteobacteria bacterium]|nr:hypothetical protein [Deltaproteobacteria bacterium]